MKVALFGHKIEESDSHSVLEFLKALKSIDAQVAFESVFLEHLKDHDCPIEADVFKAEGGLDQSFDLFVSFGGDGTMLRAVTIVKDLGIPIVGINTGRLGYLSTFNKEEVQRVITEFIAGAYTIEERSLITLENASSLGFDLNFALNEITVIRKDTTSMITVETYLDGEYLTSYWADGLIVATPTGSTGYSLSCGGPVIAPLTRSMVLTPIAPHNLNARPLVISEDTEVKIKVSGRESQHVLSLDSRLAVVATGTELIIKKAAFKVKMVKFNSESFISTLRKKLLWGEDKRN